MAHPSFLLKSAIGIIILAAIYPYIFARLQALSLFFANRPGRITEIRTWTDHSVKFRDRIRNCEDGLIVEEDGIAILSCDAGRDLYNTVMGTFATDFSSIPPGELLMYRYHHSAGRFSGLSEELTLIKLLDFPGVKEFHPLGVEYHRPSSTLFVCNHHYDGSRLEIFSLDLDSFTTQPVAKHTRTIISPFLRSPNAITALSDHELYVSNDHYYLARENPWLAKVETYAGIPWGTLVYVNLSAGDSDSDSSPSVHPVAHVPFANGVTLLNASILAVASTSTSRVRLYDIQPDHSLREFGVINVPFMPDNLSTDKRGTLLIAGHPHPPSLEKVIKSRSKCVNDDARNLDNCLLSASPSWVAEWTPDSGLKNVYVTKGEFGSSTTAM